MPRELDPVRSLPFASVEVDDVVRFGPTRRWALVREITRSSPVHWWVMWTHGPGTGTVERVTPNPAATYVAKSAEGAARDRRDLL